MPYSIQHINKLWNSERLILILDLDDTLISTFPVTENDVRKDHDSLIYISLKGIEGRDHYFCIKRRPYLNVFLSYLKQYFELHLMSAGTEHYVKKIVNIIDPTGQFFGDRLISREGIIQENKALTTRHLFPFGKRIIIAVDDRTDVWENSPWSIKIKPFDYFSLISDNKLYKSILSQQITFVEKLKLFPKKNFDVTLRHLRSHLESIHHHFFEQYERYNSGNLSVDVPDVSKIIEKLRNDVDEDFYPNKNVQIETRVTRNHRKIGI